MKYMGNKKYQLFLSFLAIVFIALGSVGGCNNSNGGGDDPLADADLIRGGLLYDKWWVAAGTDEPEGTNPLYPTEENAMFNDPPRAGSQTWRCKECHGWDYLGVDGFYGPPSSHFTNIEGVLQVADLLFQSRNEGDHSAEELFDIIKFGIVGQMSAYEGLMSDQDIWDLVKFLKEGLIDNRFIVDYSSPDMNEVIEPFFLDIGEMLFNDICAGCHGMDGEGLEAFGTEGISLNDVALGNPVEFMHKIRMGQPGTFMPSMVDLGFDTDDAKDVLAWAQMGLVPVGEGCCVFGENDCEDGLGQEACELDGGVFDAEVLCDDVAECNVAPPGEGCCVFGENDCEDGLGQEACELDGGVFDAEVLCDDVAECNVAPPLDGEILYIDNCQFCHGVDGVGGFAGDVVGESAQEITDALMLPSMAGVAPLTPAEIDAIAAFLDM